MEETRSCLNGHTGTGIGFEEGCPECEAPWVTPPETSSWEEEFDEKFGTGKPMKAYYDTEKQGVVVEDCTNYDKVKDFIRSIATSEYKRGRKDEREEKEKEWQDFNRKLMS